MVLHSFVLLLPAVILVLFYFCNTIACNHSDLQLNNEGRKNGVVWKPDPDPGKFENRIRIQRKGLFFFHSLCYYTMWRTWFSRYLSENFRHSTLLIWLWIKKKNWKFKKNFWFFSILPKNFDFFLVFWP